MKTLIVIVGPTGVGKTELCLKVAEAFGTVIVNADSRQIFKEIPVGTAAPTIAERRRIRHFFVGNLHIDQYYNASMFENDVIALLDTLFKEKDYVIMSGGSMMYVDAVCNGIDDIPTVDTATRSKVMREYEEKGLDYICGRLEELDPEYYSIVDKRNPKRVIHAVEICLSTGRTYTSFRVNAKKDRPFNIIKVGLTLDREQLYERIDGRVDRMVADGLIQEAEKMYPYRNLNSLNTVGYKELFDYFDGKCTLEEAVFRIKCDTHKYCRKQLTWFKRDKDIHWFSPNNVEEIINYIRSCK
ncbi:tRNA (adenosine(37)-N6)-dimethylallyltransferase MiaA [Marseilla massiliensis]|uniref:tRNA dimethylallyltransferase n=1 Tax=Marseilla massiliensis TaxID=1841864 RepID=A0A939B6K2_9BACT|nr:tRNA (adenosine(37)-N6)-dimethylallyltransferase MiaA [Marseilla massiliensis]MBM6672640.1 tRNA (adenosine(37)-N6)-dimethylallyltransferase MiaA [Marseilla massiliensis]CCY66339.1 tRNA delta(2)-isopentenylpyrophosphate transferase [Prevotella sp. CAG:1124]